MSGKRHSWSEPERYAQHSDRVCWDCGLIKRTRHEFDGPRAVHWVEWRRGDARVEAARTPACEPVESRVLQEARAL